MKTRHAERRLWLLLGALAAVVAVVAMLFGGGQTVSSAGSILVSTTNDELNLTPLSFNGQCSLREAIQAANTNTAVDSCKAGTAIDTITVPAGTYTLTRTGAGEDANATGDLDLTDTTGTLTINGAGATSAIIDGAAHDRVFDIHPLVTATISGLAIQHGGGLGPATSAGNVGGGIRNAGTLVLNNSTVSGSSASYGGGVYNTGAVTMNGSTVSGNTANIAGSGGGIVNSYGTLTLNNSTVSGNTANKSVGGIFNIFGTLTLNDSTVSGNMALADQGGIRNEGTATLSSSTVSGNSAGHEAAGIENDCVAGGTLTINNSTVSGNTTVGYIGGIYNFCYQGSTLTPLTINNSTVSSNSGRGIYNSSCCGSVKVKNTIVANSSGGDCSGAITSAGHNLSSDATCAFSGAGDLNSTPPQLGPLALNSPGTTETHALCTGLGAPVVSCTAASLAIDAVPVSDCTDTAGNLIATDQRGVSRPQPQGGACDIGAYEAATSSITICKQTDPAGGTGFNFGWSAPLIRTRPFPLNDGDCTTFDLDPSQGPYTFSELPPPAGWQLVNIVCTGGANILDIVSGVTINLKWGEVVTCTFTNSEVTPTPTPSCANPTASPAAAWWPLNETAGATVVDIAGGHSGTASPGPVGPIVSTNGPAPANLWPPVVNASGPKVGGALYFWGQGQNRFVSVPSTQDLPLATSDFSIDAWVFITQYSGTDIQPIVEKMQYHGTTLVQGYRFYLESGVLTFTAVGPGGGPAVTAVTQVGSQFQLSQASWHHVAVTYRRGATIQNHLILLYIDGVQRVTNNLPNIGSLNNNADLIIGGRLPGPATNYLDIAIDELQFFNSVLSAQDIQSIYEASPAGKCTPTPTPTPAPRKQCGDVNDDGTVNAIDALAMLQYIAGLTPALPNVPSADVNGDGTINALDALLVLQHSAGLVPTLRC